MHSCRFEEKSNDRATNLANLPWRNSSLFSSWLGAQKKNRVSEVQDSGSIVVFFLLGYLCQREQETVSHPDCE